MRNSTDFPRFSKNEMANRHARTELFMEEHDVQALLVFGSGRFSKEVYWLTDWPGSRESYVLFQKNRDPAVILQLYNHVPMARVLSVIEDVRWAYNLTQYAHDKLEARRAEMLCDEIDLIAL